MNSAEPPKAFRSYHIWALMIVVILAGTTLVQLDGCHAPVAVRTDGVMIDRGWGFHYPRFSLRFPPVRLTNGTTQEFRQRAPTRTMTFSMELGDHPSSASREDDLQSLISNQVEFRVWIQDSKGRKIVDVARPVEQWVVGKSTRRWEFWTPETRDGSYQRGAIYTLNIQASSPKGDFPAVIVRPLLEGGGWELP